MVERGYDNLLLNFFGAFIFSPYMFKSPIFPNIIFNSFLSVIDILIDTICREGERGLIGEVEYYYELKFAVMGCGGYTYVSVI